MYSSKINNIVKYLTIDLQDFIHLALDDRLQSRSPRSIVQFA